MTAIDEKKRALERKLEAVEVLKKTELWAEKELGKYTHQEREGLLRYLTEWKKSQPGHGRDCDCGECD